MESMTTMMDRRISEYVRAIDPITGRKRIFAFMANKVTELHRTGDTIALLIMTEEGELKVVVADYLLVSDPTGEDLMEQIYNETFVNYIGLSPAVDCEQCTGSAFDGAYFHLNR